MNILTMKKLSLRLVTALFMISIPLTSMAVEDPNDGPFSHVGQLGNVIKIKLEVTGGGDAKLIFTNPQLQAAIGNPNLPDDTYVTWERPNSTELSCVKNSGIDYLPLGAFRNTAPSTLGRIVGPIYVFDREEDGGKFLKLRYFFDLSAVMGVGADATITNLLGPDNKVLSIDSYILTNGVAFNPAPQIVVDMVNVKREVLDNVCPDGIEQKDLGL